MRLTSGKRGRIEPSTAVTLAAVAVVVALIQVLPGVGRERAATPGKDRVEVWAWNSAAMSLQSLTPGFAARKPDAELDVKMSGTAMQSRFLLSVSSGRGAPDIMQLQEREAGKYTKTGKLVDFTDWAQKYEHDFPASFWQSCLVDGRVMAMPWDIAPCAIVYKRWIFERYGIDPEQIETWDDLIAAGRIVVQKSNGQTKMMPLATNGLGMPVQMLMQQNGGGIFDAQGRIILDSPQNREALELIHRLLESGICSQISAGPEMKVSYNDDSVACYAMAVWDVANVKEAAASRAGQWGMIRLPAFRPGGLRNSNQGGSVLVVPAQSDAIGPAMAFIEYSMCTVDAQLKQYADWSLFPAYLPAQRDPRFDQPDAFFGGQHVAKLFAQDFERVPPLVRTRDWDEAEQYVNTTLYDWARQQQDSAAYLKKMSNLLSARLGRPIAPPSNDPARP